MARTAARAGWLHTATMAGPGGNTDKAYLYDLLVVGGRVIDPGSKFDGVADVAVKAGRIAAVGPNLQRDDAAEIFDAAGLLVTPGLVDTHVHVYLLL